MLNFLLLICLVVLLNKFLTKKATVKTYSNKPHSINTNNTKMVQVIQSEAEFKTAISAANLVVVDFFAVWCGPCKMIAPMLEKFSNDYSNVSFYKVDVDQLPTVAQSNDVSSMPTILFFKNGEVVGKVIGANPGAIKQTIDKLA
ncbi:thioredoxin [Pichia kluyveri]|uniref:Thioredoxin n=1 Tax=Pichia kluyveri TaxID=36015 RepID=A0AAV5R6G2_PICKL|nr:thioredoxin [Pichia kluyveri]